MNNTIITTNWSAIDSLQVLLFEVNTFAPFWTGILYMIFMVLTITFLPFGFVTAILSGSLLSFFLGLILSYAGLVPWRWTLTLFGLFIATIIYDTLFANKEK